jgi:hypothetical protein
MGAAVVVGVAPVLKAGNAPGRWKNYGSVVTVGGSRRDAELRRRHYSKKKAQV